MEPGEVVGGGGGERPRGELAERRKKGSEPRTSSVEMCSGLRVPGTGTGEPEDGVVVEGGCGADASRGWEAEEGACGDGVGRWKKGSERKSLPARETGGTEEDDCGAGAGSTGGAGTWTSMMVCLVSRARSSDWSLSEASWETSGWDSSEHCASSSSLM